MTKNDAFDPKSALAPWIGESCNQVLRHEHNWTFQFGDAGSLLAECSWRILANGGIAHAREDDGQKFGLPNPVNGTERATNTLAGRKVVSIEVLPISGDLKIHFEGDCTLELFNDSSGYEAWQANATRAGKTLNLVAQGGGKILVWEQ